jgi:hypothetical protein
MTTAETTLKRLIALTPGFAAGWDAPGNCFREDDGSFTHCGVFAEFSSFFRQSYGQLSSDRVAAIGKFIAECVESEDTELANAAATCFLENITAETFSDDFKRFLSGESLRFYSLWDNPSAPG